jgi:nitrite reductase (NO-forming)
MFTRRAAMFSAAAAVLMLAGPSFAAERNLPRERVELVAPPFVHAHEQATSKAPRSWNSSS